MNEKEHKANRNEKQHKATTVLATLNEIESLQLIFFNI